MTSIEQPVRDAYAEGLRRLRQRDDIGGSKAGAYALLPAAILDSRNDIRDLSDAPGFEQLSIGGQLAVKIFYDVIENIGDPIERYPMVLEPIAILQSELPAFLSAPLDRGASGQLSPKGRADFSRVIQAVAPAVQYLWDKGDAFVAQFLDGESVSHSRPAIVLVRQARGDGRWETATSWLGGAPRLGSRPWPLAGGRPMHHLAQIDLAAIQRVAAMPDLPRNGALAFFISANADGAVIHVPAGEDGENTTPPAGLPDLQEVGGRLGYTGDRTGAPLFPCWPIDLIAVETTNDAGPDTAIRKLEGMLSDAYRRRQFNLAAEAVFEEADIAARPQWWRTALEMADMLGASLLSIRPAREGWQLRLLARIAGQRQQLQEREAFAAFVAEVQAWAGDNDPWTRMSSQDAQHLKAVLEQALGRFRAFLPSRGHLLRTVEDMTLLQMAVADRDTFATLPEGVRTKIDRDYRLPIHGWHQMFGVPISIQGNAAMENTGRHLLIQFASDDMMCWSFASAGVCQFWIDPGDLKAGNWSAANVTFEGD